MVGDRPLYLMAKPAAEALARIGALPRTARERPLDLAHVTLLAFFDLRHEAPRLLACLVGLLDGFQAQAFPVSFDHIRERRAVTLRPTRAPSAARRFQRGLGRYHARRGFTRVGAAPEAHLTISYRPDGRGAEPIDPIGWLVEDVLLVESVHGEARHVVHGRWLLQRQWSLL